MTTLLRYGFLSLLILLLDQVSKYWAYTRLRTGTDVSVIEGLFKLSYVENPGIAFSFWAQSDSTIKIWVLAGTSLLAIGLVIYFASQSPAKDYLLRIALMFILGGIVGNLIDRLRLGVVIDFIEFYLGQYHWPTFNIADAAICVGAVLLGIDILKKSPDAAKNNASVAEQGE